MAEAISRRPGIHSIVYSLRPRCSGSDRVGQQRHHEGLLQPPLAVGPLEQGEVGAAVVEVERGPQPEDLHGRRIEVGGRLLTDAPDAPRAVAGGPGAGRVDLEGDAGGQGDRALPRPPLGEAGVVHHRHVVADDLLAGLLDGLGAGPEGDVGGEAVVVLAHHVAHGAEGLDDLDAQRPDLRRPVRRHGAGREHRVLDAVVHDRECRRRSRPGSGSGPWPRRGRTRPRRRSR